MKLKKKISILHNDYEQAIKFCLIYQAILGLLAGMCLDYYQLLQFWTVSMAAFWGSVVVLICRNPHNPKKFDILYIKWAFLFIVVVVPFAMKFGWKIRGIKF